MGKRELVIVAVFVALGALTFRLAAPPSGDTRRRFSLERLTDVWKRQRPPALASVTTEGRLPVSPRLSSIRLSSFSTVDVRGEARDDAAWTLTVDASGPDEASARAAAERATMQHDDMGDIVAMSVRSADDGRQTSTLVLRVPAQLAVRIEGTRRTEVGGVSAVRLENVVGDTSVRAVAGLVDGTHHNGRLAIEDADGVRLTLVTSEAVLQRIRGASTIHARNGQARLERFEGPATIDVRNQRLLVVEPAAATRVSGGNSTVDVERPRGATEVDTRQTRVQLTLDRAVPATVFTTDAHVGLTIDPSLPIELDVVSESGTIDASQLALTPTKSPDDMRLAHAIGHDARVAIRSQRSSIVIAAGK